LKAQSGRWKGNVMIVFLRFIFLVMLAAQPLQLFAEIEYPTVRGSVLLPAGHRFRKPIVLELRGEGEIIGTTRTDAAGNFEFRPRQPGEYVIHVSAEGFQEAEYPANTSAGSSRVEIHLLELSPSNTGSGNAPQGPLVQDVRQLSMPKKARVEYEKAVGYLRAGKTQNAVAHLHKALQIAPNFYDPHFQLGMLYMKVNQQAEAEQALARAAELNPRVADPLVVLGLLYLYSGRLEESTEVLNRAVALDPASAPAHYYLGSALFQAGQSSRAEKLLKRSLLLDPTNYPVHLALVNLYLKEARPQEACWRWRRTLRESPMARKAVRPRNCGQSYGNSYRSKSPTSVGPSRIPLLAEEGAKREPDRAKLMHDFGDPYLTWIVSRSPRQRPLIFFKPFDQRLEHFLSSRFR